MTFHLEPRNFMFYLSVPLILYFNLQFLDNSVAKERNYTDSESTGIIERGPERSGNKISENSFLFKDIGFTFKVHQKTFKSLIPYKSEGTVLMADTFEHDKPVRSFRIVDGNTSQSHLVSYIYGNAFKVSWFDLNFCKSYPETAASFQIYIYKDGTIQYNISWVDMKHKNCNMTIEIRDGIYNLCADGNGTIIQEEVIHKKVYPSSSIVDGKVFTFVPQPRCRAQTSEMNCTDESQPKASCTWCPDSAKCVHNASQCIVAETHSPGSNSVYYIPVIVVGILIVVAFTVWFILRKYNK